MKNSEGRAVNRCWKYGIAISRNKYRKLVQEYNNYEMPISKRHMLIARDFDNGFIEFIKDKI